MQCARAVAYGIFFTGRKFGGGAFLSDRHKYRVIAEAARAARDCGNAALPCSLGNDGILIRRTAHERYDAAVARAAARFGR